MGMKELESMPEAYFMGVSRLFDMAGFAAFISYVRRGGVFQIYQGAAKNRRILPVVSMGAALRAMCRLTFRGAMSLGPTMNRLQPCPVLSVERPFWRFLFR